MPLARIHFGHAEICPRRRVSVQRDHARGVAHPRGRDAQGTLDALRVAHEQLHGRRPGMGGVAQRNRGRPGAPVVVGLEPAAVRRIFGDVRQPRGESLRGRKLVDGRGVIDPNGEPQRRAGGHGGGHFLVDLQAHAGHDLARCVLVEHHGLRRTGALGRVPEAADKRPHAPCGNG
jgi:hypothetical protein